MFIITAATLITVRTDSSKIRALKILIFKFSKKSVNEFRIYIFDVNNYFYTYPDSIINYFLSKFKSNIKII